MDKMKRMRKSIIWMAAFMFCCGAVFAQKAERKNAVSYTHLTLPTN